ncbi:MAG: hypothetical protein WC753_00365 [Candidatus Gracilibacteria bacterium]|jgi:hypothetical protein
MHTPDPATSEALKKLFVEHPGTRPSLEKKYPSTWLRRRLHGLGKEEQLELRIYTNKKIVMTLQEAVAGACRRILSLKFEVIDPGVFSPMCFNNPSDLSGALRDMNDWVA